MQNENSITTKQQYVKLFYIFVIYKFAGLISGASLVQRDKMLHNHISSMKIII